jgi:predicted metal-dependent hydrolase
MAAYNRLYVEFLYYFNAARDYFECHEVMEELWMEEGRNPYYQGLLQIAVGLYHHRNGNPNGSVKLFTQGLEKLDRFPAEKEGIDVGILTAESRTYLERLHGLETEPFAAYDLDIRITDPELDEAVERLTQHPPHKEEDGEL